MQLGIPLNAKDNPLTKSNKNEGRTTCGRPDGNHQDGTSFVTPLQRPNQFNKSSSLGNLSFINIVGLPCHPRQTSVPSSTTLRNQVGFDGTVLPNHFRNASESNAAPPRPPRLNVNNTEAAKVPPKGQTGWNQTGAANVQGVKGLEETSQGATTNLVSRSKVHSVPESTQWHRTKFGANFQGGTMGKSDAPPVVPRGDSCGRYCESEPKQTGVIGTKSTPGTSQSADNVSNVNVNFYRAVPMNVISSVPTIKCLNTNSAKNVSNVQIMPLTGTNIDQNSCGASGTCTTSSQVTVHNTQTPTQLIGSSASETVSSVYLTRTVPQRTFTSTEAQTDDTALCCPELSSDKERRRRERRERRQNRRANPVNSRHPESGTQTSNAGSSLPDILDSHLPPPYTTHPNTLQRSQPPPSLHPGHGRSMPPMGILPPPVAMPPPQVLSGMVPPPRMVPHPRSRVGLQNVPSNVSFPAPTVIPGQVPLVQNVPDVNSGYRFALPVGQFRRDHFSEEAPKGCCGVLSWKPGSLKWFIASIALVAVGCVLVGTALGTMRPAGRDHITVALLMIGIGIVLVTISGIAWRLASQNTSSCRTMLGIGSLESVDVCTRRFVPRLPPSYGRPHHPYAAMMYPEFQYRPPPPTYQASMQEYRLRLLLIDRGNTPQIQAGAQNAVSPPPTYRSHNGSLIRDPLSIRNDAAWSEYSCPPSYRSQTYSSRLGTIQDSVSVHTRDPSLTMSEQTNENAIDVVNILSHPEEEITIDTKTEDESPFKLILEDCGGSFESNKEDNLVTIVQRDDHNPVIVTVSGSSSTENSSGDNKMPSEIQILAHL